MYLLYHTLLASAGELNSNLFDLQQGSTNLEGLRPVKGFDLNRLGPVVDTVDVEGEKLGVFVHGPIISHFASGAGRPEVRYNKTMNTNEMTWKPKGWKRAVRVEVIERRSDKTKVRVLEGRRKGQEPIVFNEELEQAE